MATLTLSSTLVDLLPPDDPVRRPSRKSVLLQAGSWKEAASELRDRYPLLAERVLTPADTVAAGFILARKDEVLLQRDPVSLTLEPEDELFLIPQVAGGSVGSPPSVDVERLKDRIRSIPDFPIAGIGFKDITPLLASPDLFGLAVDGVCAALEGIKFDRILAVESRGFVLGAALAARLHSGIVLVRKPGKLPGDVDRFAYSCEYCTGDLEVCRGAVEAGLSYLVVDDVLATGGTARACADYVLRQRGAVAGYAFLLELSFLEGRALLADAPVVSLIPY
jgi:adenine phosphoribosyltransferase